MTSFSQHRHLADRSCEAAILSNGSQERTEFVDLVRGERHALRVESTRVTAAIDIFYAMFG